MNKSEIYKNTFVILPALNEATRISRVIADIKSLGIENIIVVNDGSKDNTYTVAKEAGAKVLTHIINRGTGAATQTGIDYAKMHNAQIVVTVDADGQHNPHDIERAIETLVTKNLDIVFGSRFLNRSNKVPFIRRIFNQIANIITFALSFIWFSDSQTGFKAMNRKAIDNIQISTNGYEFCTEIITQMKVKDLKYLEIPIDVNYSKDSMMKGQNFATGITTVIKLFLQSLSR